MPAQITQEMISEAIKAQNKYGVPASVTLAQLMHESSGNFPGGLSGLAYEYNNYFGIMKGNWTGKTVQYDTRIFRAYNSMSESFDDHGKLLTYNVYRNKTDGATNLNDYVRRMASVYCPDDDNGNAYANKIIGYINDYNLTQYDNGSLPDKIVQTSPETDTLDKYKNNPWFNITGSSSTTQKETSDTGGYKNPFGAYKELAEEIKDGKNPVDVFGEKYEEVKEDTKDKLFGWWDDLWTSVTFTIVIILLVVLAVVFLLKAFNMMPTKQNLISKIVPVSAPAKTEAKENE